ncbi:MAG: hypothetical protein HRJ53_14255 [Acidobacteria bacterium Pan2503]|uniref:Uncharacterized protein n=1 Tax=Candidatus Acidiferrum panamense TaxID=2741543 RepID=A0A7V8SXR0_9BACT|nr:hypothetical protein [Candidatus Acidoferrum panamensis]
MIVSAREGQRARAAALEAIADLNEGIAQDEDPDFDPASTHDPEQDVAADTQHAADAEAQSIEEAQAEGEEAEQPAELTEPPAEEPAEAPPAKQAEAPAKHRIKVNGREIELTYEELLARAQKVESADQYLAEAARVRHEQNQAPAARQPAPPAARPSDEEDAALARAMQLGTEEEAVAAIRSLRNSASAQADQIVSTVDERIGFLQAVDRFSKDYADIIGDPVLSSIAFAMDKHLKDSGDKRPYQERYAWIGDQLRGKLRGWAQKYGAENAQKLEEKTQRKRAAPANPQQAGSKALPQPDEDDEDGPEDYSKWIRQEAERRGRRYGVN